MAQMFNHHKTCVQLQQKLEADEEEDDDDNKHGHDVAKLIEVRQLAVV